MTGRLVYVCEGEDCSAQGSIALCDRLRALLAGDPATEVRTYPCFGGCGKGPNLVVHPDRAFYSGVGAADLPEIISAMAGGQRVQRLCGKVDPDVEQIAFDLVAAGF